MGWGGMGSGLDRVEGNGVGCDGVGPSRIHPLHLHYVCFNWKHEYSVPLTVTHLTLKAHYVHADADYKKRCTTPVTLKDTA